MAIVPNLNGVQISSQTPLVDPRNLSTKERLFWDDNYNSTSEFTLADGNQLILGATQIRNNILFMNANEENDTVYISTTPMTTLGQGIPLFAGNGFQFRGKAAQLTFYCWGIAPQQLTIMVG